MTEMEYFEEIHVSVAQVKCKRVSQIMKGTKRKQK